MRRLLVLFLLAFAQLGYAQQYPNRPVRLVVGFPPGGGVDINARLLAPKLSEFLGQQFVVDNKPGAGTNIANEFVAKAPPDGYTLLLTSPALAINMSLYSKLPFDTMRDFAPVSMFSESPNLLLVPAALPVANAKELIARAKAMPGKLNYSSAGPGTSQHLAGVLLMMRTGISAVHIPYKGSAPSLTALIAGEVDFSFAKVTAVQGYIKAGRLRALGVSSSARAPAMPEVPTIAEAGVPGYEFSSWFGLFAPAGTPREVIARLYMEAAKAMAQPEVRERLPAMGNEAVGSTPEQFTAKYQADIAKYAAVVKAAGIPPAD